MQKIRCIVAIIIFNCLLNACNSSFEADESSIKNVKNSKAHAENAYFVANRSNRVVKKIGGSDIPEERIFNSDKSISCSLKSWELIGVFKNNQLGMTQGEFIFEITNHAPQNYSWVIFELLILDEEGNVQTTSNPFKDLQGENIEISPPIEQGQTKTLVRRWKYRSGWHDVTLKSCQWANSHDDYWKKYPELENYLAP